MANADPPAPPCELRVRQAANSHHPAVSWKGNADGRVDHYEVAVIDEDYGDQLSDYVIETQQVPVPTAGRDPHFVIRQSHPDSVHRVEVTAVSECARGNPELVRFYPQSKLIPNDPDDVKRIDKLLKKAGDELEPICVKFSTTMDRDPRFLLIGKQHHGKSSLLNHLVRCLKQKMNTPDEVEAAPPSELETTIRSTIRKVPFRQHSFTFYDMPAFSNMNRDRKKDLNNLLWHVNSNWARGERSWSTTSNPPDAIIIVVSLMSWRDERESLAEYLRQLQALLKHEHKANTTTVFPYVVAVTHLDTFLEEEGNAGRNPANALKEAERELQSMANTQYVYLLTNYKTSSWWVPAVTNSTYEMLGQVTTLAKNRTRGTQESLFTTLVVMACVFGVLAWLVRWLKWV